MIELSSDELTVEILDPEEDADRFGPRYCTGGYIFQIEDGKHGRLLTGPTYPDSFNWFDGQGIPDGFNHTALREPGSTAADSLVPGIGICNPATRTVLRYCRWNIDTRDTSVTMTTAQAMGPFSLELERTVALSGRVVRSTTAVTNRGAAQIPVVWYPHPFFPHGGDGPLCLLPGPVDFDGRGVYTLDGAGYFHCSNWEPAHSISVECGGPPQPGVATPLTVLYRHPVVGLIAAVFSYPPGHVLLWGNPNTFSFEPYFERTVGRGRRVQWSMEYHF